MGLFSLKFPVVCLQTKKTKRYHLCSLFYCRLESPHASMLEKFVKVVPNVCFSAIVNVHYFSVQILNHSRILKILG